MIRQIALSTVSFTCLAAAVFAGDQPQWGQKHSRNMVSDETGFSDGFDGFTADSGAKWTARLGSITYATPVVAGGKVLVGTNNRHPRD